MFERFTEEARRVIFFARYDASQYGSHSIDTEHLLLGLLREDNAVTKRLIPEFPSLDQIRKEVEDKIHRGERFSTSVEVPLTTDSKRVLNLAAEEADRFGHGHIGTEHLLLGLLGVDRSLAATILVSHGANLSNLREQLARQSVSQVVARSSSASAVVAFDTAAAMTQFLGQLRAGLADEAQDFLAPQAQYIDAHGKRWSGEDGLHKRMAELLAPFAARGARFILEESIQPLDSTRIATVLWEDVPLPEKPKISLLRMTVVLGRGEEGLSIYSLQVTPVVVP
jgi:hypothetical protein